MKLTEKQKGILYILSAAFFFSLMTLFVRLSGDLPSCEKALFRNLFAAIIAWIMLIKSKEKITIKKNEWFDLIMRSACGCIGVVCNFYAISRLNLADANILNKLSPFFAILFSIFLLKEKANLIEWSLVIIAFIGAFFIIKPGFSIDAFPAFMGFIGGLGAGVAYTFVRRLGKKGTKGTIIVMFFSTFSTIVLIPLTIIGFKPMTPTQFIYLILAGISAAGGQLSITAAYTHAPAKEISIYDYSQVIFASVWGIILFGEIPDIYSIIGYIIIISAALLRFFYNQKQDNNKSK